MWPAEHVSKGSKIWLSPNVYQRIIVKLEFRYQGSDIRTLLFQFCLCRPPFVEVQNFNRSANHFLSTAFTYDRRSLSDNKFFVARAGTTVRSHTEFSRTEKIGRAKFSYKTMKTKCILQWYISFDALFWAAVQITVLHAVPNNKPCCSSHRYIDPY